MREAGRWVVILQALEDGGLIRLCDIHLRFIYNYNPKHYFLIHDDNLELLLVRHFLFQSALLLLGDNPKVLLLLNDDPIFLFLQNDNPLLL